MRKARPSRAAADIQLVLGRNVHEFREAAGMSQERLAELAAVSRGYLSRIESGHVNVTLSTIVRIANVFQVEVIDLLTRY